MRKRMAENEEIRQNMKIEIDQYERTRVQQENVIAEYERTRVAEL